MKHDGHHCITSQADFADSDECCLQTCQDGIEAEDVTLHLLTLYAEQQMVADFLLVTRLK